MKYKLTIGLEIHAQLKTETKMFCRSANDPEEKRANTNTCPICLGHPGTLPTINKVAVRHVLQTGLAIGGEIADFTEFDRKNYFYPDLPKGYQISQYKHPLVSGGSLSGVAITRIHLEEDTARSVHDAESGASLIDFNRAGVPLMELVTEPVIETAAAAGNFARELQLLLRYLGVSEANMEKGQMRVEANISVAAKGASSFGTKVEVKNLNSFRSVERAIAYELKRQSELLDDGGKVVQETRGWDEARGVTYGQREKESAHDYRYFPEPDLPKLKISEIPDFQNLELPELPWQKRKRLSQLNFLQTQDVEQLVGNIELSRLFDQIESIFGVRDSSELMKIATNFILNDIVGQKKKDPVWPIPQAVFLAEIVHKYKEGVMAAPQAKQALVSGQMVDTVDESSLPELVQQVINDNPKVAEDYRGGKATALQFLIGQGMKLSRGAANPQILETIFKKKL